MINTDQLVIVWPLIIHAIIQRYVPRRPTYAHTIRAHIPTYMYVQANIQRHMNAYTQTYMHAPMRAHA